jgi:prephenate dehydrogenase
MPNFGKPTDNPDAKPKIAILGLGLMGGSLGLALTRLGYTVIGWNRSPESTQEALRLGAITVPAASLQEAMNGAEIVFVGTTVETIPEIIKNCLPYAAPGTIFTDMGSIKEQILEKVSEFLPPTHFFVAAHPMTGSEQQGVSAADPFLYQNAAYIIVEDPRTPRIAVNKVVELVKSIGASVIKLSSAAEHDRIVAMVSHLPHLIATTLAKTAGLEEEMYPGTLNLAAGGFRDTTRVALGSSKIWEGIIFENKAKVLQAITSFQTELAVLKSMLENDERPKVKEFLDLAREIRSQIPAKNKGFLTLLHEMVVTVEDKPGAIEEVLRHLSEAGLNIKDIEILRVREGDGGTLRIAFEHSQAVEEAVRILTGQGFKARRR